MPKRRGGEVDLHGLPTTEALAKFWQHYRALATENEQAKRPVESLVINHGHGKATGFARTRFEVREAIERTLPGALMTMGESLVPPNPGVTILRMPLTSRERGVLSARPATLQQDFVTPESENAVKPQSGPPEVVPDPRLSREILKLLKARQSVDSVVARLPKSVDPNDVMACLASLEREGLAVPQTDGTWLSAAVLPTTPGSSRSRSE